MTRQQFYPNADRNAQNFYAQYPVLFAGRFMSNVNTLVLHTTEGNSWPGYLNGSECPTFTYDPRSHQMRQHIPVDMAARALVQMAGGVTTNRMNCAQIEIIGYAAQGGPLDAQAIADLGALLAWLNAEWSVPIVAPYAFSATNYHRMSDPEWSAFKGVCGHQHVPQNVHWDPGAMDVAAILDTATITTAPTTQEDTMQRLMQLKGHAEIYLTDGLTAQHMLDANLLHLATLVTEGTANLVQKPGAEGWFLWDGLWVRITDDPTMIGKVN